MALYDDLRKHYELSTRWKEYGVLNPKYETNTPEYVKFLRGITKTGKEKNINFLIIGTSKSFMDERVELQKKLS